MLPEISIQPALETLVPHLVLGCVSARVSVEKHSEALWREIDEHLAHLSAIRFHRDGRKDRKGIGNFRIRSSGVLGVLRGKKFSELLAAFLGIMRPATCIQPPLRQVPVPYAQHQVYSSNYVAELFHVRLGSQAAPGGAH